LPKSFIEKHKNKLDWYLVSKYQKLSESFIEKHKDELNWRYISIDQKLSEKFIRKHESLLDLKEIYYNKKTPKEIIECENGKYFLVEKKGKEILVPIEIICPVCAKLFISKKKLNVCSNCKAIFVI